MSLVSARPLLSEEHCGFVRDVAMVVVVVMVAKTEVERAGAGWGWRVMLMQVTGTMPSGVNLASGVKFRQGRGR